MAEKVFPDLAQKLNAPVRKTAFERQKEEAEAKRKREEAETAAALKEFEESFADEDGDQSAAGHGFNSGFGNRGSGLGFRGGMFGGTPRGRGFGPMGMKGSGPGSLLPPPSLMPGRKRGYDGSFAPQQAQQPRQNERGMFSYNDGVQGESKPGFESDEEMDDEEKGKAAPRLTVQLSDLPMGTTQEEVLTLFQEQVPKLRVDKVEIMPPPAPSSSTKKSLSAMVTMADGAVSREVDAAITILQRFYLGLGHRLTINRTTASAVPAYSSAQTPHSDALPFGAKVLELEREQPQTRYNMAAPPPEQGYRSALNGHANLPSTVYVKVPSDLRQLKLINKTIEGLIKIGPEFEAALMQRPEVRSEEKWSWLFDASSIGGVYFRWRLWYLTSGRFNEREEERNEAGTQAPEVIFRDEAPWQAPDRRPRFERVRQVDEFLSDPEYDEDEEDFSDSEENKKMQDLDLTGEANDAQYLNPLHRAHLTHLLARLPTSPANLRRGDVARVSAFAYRNAPHGAEEVVQMLVLNVLQPLALTDANPFNQPPEGVEYVEEASSGDEDDGNAHHELSDDVVPSTELKSSLGSSDATAEPANNTLLPRGQEEEKEDNSSANLIGLYIISDVLHGCDIAGVRNAWKYKGLVEKGIRDQTVFEQLGRMERDMGWGRVKADRWKNRVMNVLDLWAGWSLFPSETMQFFIDTFKNPPLTEEEKAQEEKERKEREVRRKAQRGKAPVIKQLDDVGREKDGHDAMQEDSEPMLPQYDGAMDVDGLQTEKSKESKSHGVTGSNGEEDMDDEDDKDIFGHDDAAAEGKAEDKSAQPVSGTSSAAKIISSRGSQRPSTRNMLDD